VVCEACVRGAVSIPDGNQKSFRFNVDVLKCGVKFMFQSQTGPSDHCDKEIESIADTLTKRFNPRRDPQIIATADWPKSRDAEQHVSIPDGTLRSLRHEEKEEAKKKMSKVSIPDGTLRSLRPLTLRV
jgi:hypothetical protein